MNKVEELSLEELKNALINSQRYLLRVPQVQNDIVILEQELAKREKVEEKVDEKENK
jgi:hypothetical protein